jgi:hypothetical protein
MKGGDRKKEREKRKGSRPVARYFCMWGQIADMVVTVNSLSEILL